MATKPEAVDSAAAPTKSKKMLIIIGAVLVLALGGGAFFFLNNSKPQVVVKGPPAYLLLDTMVVNLADPGGEKVAQVGITLETIDAHASDSVKAYLPTIRSSVLMLISQRTSEELLKPEGKQKLIKDILREASIPFGGGDEDPEDEAAAKKKKPPKKVVHAEYPVVGVLFSSFIVQ